MEPVYIAVIGVGGVGSLFLSQLATLQKTHPNIHLVALTRSSHSLSTTPPDTIPLSDWSASLSGSTSPGISPSSVSAVLQKYSSSSHSSSNKGSSSRTIVIDNTSSQSVADAYPTFLTAGHSIVTPNKKAFSSAQDLWDRIFAAAYHPSLRPAAPLVYHESSVGAGLPVISTLTDLVASGDRVRRIEGVMSGSLSFLFNSFMPLSSSSSSSSPGSSRAGGSDRGTPWSAHVRQAQELGYTEPDPRDDLSGLDVARKLVILARVAGLKVEGGTDSFPIQSLIPKELEDAKSGEEFLARLPEFDGEMERMREEARQKGKVVRYVGAVDVAAKKLSVGMQWLERSSPLAGLEGSANVFGFWTERYGGSPLVVQGAGAGGEVTAMGVTADLIKVVQRLR